MSVHLLSIYINELDNRTEDTLLLTFADDEARRECMDEGQSEISK